MIKTYLHIFVKWKQNNGTRLLPIAKFVYNNAENVTISHTMFGLNYGYHSCVLFSDKVTPYLKSYFVRELIKELRKLILICQQNLLYTQKLQKLAHNKGVKFCNNTLDKNIQLHNKYIKTKHNRKLKVNYFGLFYVVHL